MQCMQCRILRQKHSQTYDDDTTRQQLDNDQARCYVIHVVFQLSHEKKGIKYPFGASINNYDLPC